METAEQREAFYDEEIAPMLDFLGAKCRANGLSFFAMAEWNPGDTGRTVSLLEGHGPTIAMANLAATNGHNADNMIGKLVHLGQKHGHSSMYLRILGVPMIPDKTD